MKKLAALLIAAVSAWIYLPCIRGTWLWDDGLEVAQNAALREAGGWWRPWVHPQGMDYFPLKSSLQWLEWHLWGANPLGYHLVNLGLHVASALLVWRLLRLLGIRCAALGGLLFAVHPLAVESVAWISEFKNTVSLPPLLLASIAYVGYDLERRPKARVISLLWFLAALACKTSVVMFPAVLLLFAWWRRGRVGVRDLLDSAPFLGASIAMGAATVWFQSTRAIGIAGTRDGLLARVGQAGWSVLLYARQSLWPAGLAPIYPPAGGSLPALAPWLAIAAVLVLFWLFRAGWGRHALLGSGWFLLNLVPVLGIVPMAYLRISPRADHFAYVPLVGWVGLAAAGFGAAVDAWRRRMGPGALARLPFALGAAAAACAMVLESRAYAAAFRDEKALWSFAVERNPRAWLARNNLGKALLEERRPGEAAAQFREAIRLEPDSPEAHANLGNCLAAEGLAADARQEYAAALGIDPGFAGAHYNLGLSLLRSGLLDQASGEFQATLRLDPLHAQAHNNLGLAFAGLGRPSEAMEHYRLALGLDPGLEEAHLNLGNAYFRMGSLDAAMREYRAALRIDPDYAGAHNNLGQALAGLGRLKEAQAEFEKARAAANH
jgi:tetratricopeptide (TPR) repeat protein